MHRLCLHFVIGLLRLIGANVPLLCDHATFNTNLGKQGLSTLTSLITLG